MEDQMQSAENFLREFMRAIIHHPMDRGRILAEWTAKLEERDLEHQEMEPNTEPEEEQ